MKHLIAYSLLALIFLGCNNTDNSCGQAYFGGEIINPSNDYLILYENALPLDTLKLDKNNRFSIHIEYLNSGLYSFVHGGEYQTLIIEPNDSILLRLNTIDFDESLVFTGRGAKKNNYLINLFNAIESEDKIVYGLSRLEPEEFQQKTDSLQLIKLNELQDFIEKNPNSELFNKVSKASIMYSYFAYKELYPFRYYGNYNLLNYTSLPKGFYAYRKSINYDDEDLKDFYPYYNFLFPHFNNLALQEYFKTSKDSVFNRNSVHYNLNKLQLIDSLVNNHDIKNNLLKYATRNFLSYCNSSEESSSVYKSYKKKSTNEKHLEYITNLKNRLNKLHPGNKFPDIEITNYKNETVNINTIINKPTVICFWSKTIKNHFKNSHKKIDVYKKEYPNIKFISININSNNSNIWKRMLKQNHFDLENEYVFRNPTVAKKILAIQYINKVMVVNSDKTLITSNANLFGKDFKYILKDLK